MAHGLEITADGTASMAFNAKGGHPWHRLGVQLDGLQDIETMLREARANYQIVTRPCFMQLDDGSYVQVPDRFVTARPHPLAGQPVLDANGEPKVDLTDDGVTPIIHPDWQPLGVVGQRYQITGHEALMLVAYGIIEADPTTGRHIDTMGVLDDGKRFFAYVKDEAPVVVDPNGINDAHEGGLGVHTRHDGSGATSFFWSLIRIVCNNTVTMAENTAGAVYRLPHSVQINDPVVMAGQARVALGMASEWSASYVRTAEQLLAVPVKPGTFRKIYQTIWPKEEGLTDRQAKLREHFESTLMEMFEGPRNAGAAGLNGYAAVQTIGEYMDHFRRGGGRNPDQSRASLSLGLNRRGDYDSPIAVKEQAIKVVLDMAGGRRSRPRVLAPA